MTYGIPYINRSDLGEAEQRNSYHHIHHEFQSLLLAKPLYSGVEITRFDYSANLGELFIPDERIMREDWIPFANR